MCVGCIGILEDELFLRNSGKTLPSQSPLVWPQEGEEAREGEMQQIFGAWCRSQGGVLHRYHHLSPYRKALTKSHIQECLWKTSITTAVNWAWVLPGSGHWKKNSTPGVEVKVSSKCRQTGEIQKATVPLEWFGSLAFSSQHLFLPLAHHFCYTFLHASCFFSHHCMWLLTS